MLFTFQGIIFLFGQLQKQTVKPLHMNFPMHISLRIKKKIWLWSKLGGLLNGCSSKWLSHWH